MNPLLAPDMWTAPDDSWPTLSRDCGLGNGCKQIPLGLGGRGGSRDLIVGGRRLAGRWPVHTVASGHTPGRRALGVRQ